MKEILNILNKNKKKIKILGSFLFIILIFYYIDYDSFYDIIKKINLIYLPVIFLFIFLFWIFYCLGLWILVYSIKKIKFKDILWDILKSLAIGVFTPANVGELSILFFLKKINMSYQQGFALYFYNKIVNFILLLFSAILIFYFFSAKIFYIIFICAFLIFILIIFLLKSNLFINLVKEKIIKTYFEKFYDFFYYIYTLNIKVIFINFIFNFIRLIIAGIIYYLTFSCLGYKENFILLLAGFNFSSIISLLPISLGGIGVHEVSAILIFAKLNLSKELVLSSCIIRRTIAFALILIIFIINIFI